MSAEGAAGRRLVIEKLRNHPLVKQWGVGLRAGGRAPPLRTAAEALGEKLGTALIFLLKANGEMVPWDVTDDEGELITSQGMEGMAARLLASVPYLWRDNVLDIVRELPVPRHTVSIATPYPYMYWTYENSKTFERSSDGLTGDIDWFVLDSNNPGELRVQSVIEYPDNSRRAISGVIRDDSVWPDDYMVAPDGRQGLLEPIFASLAFLNTPYVGETRARLQRQTRRALQRAGHDSEPDVHVVTLRTMPPAPPDDLSDPSGVEWVHRWWVAGHLRAQWYPSLKAHRLIWIDPYLKGPDGAPMIEKVYDVAR